MSTFSRVLRLLKPHRFKIIGALAIHTVVALTVLMIPRLTARVVNEVIEGGKHEMLYPLCGMILALTVVRAAGTFCRGYGLMKVSQTVVRDLRSSLYAHLEQLPWEFYDKHRVGDIMSRMTSDIEGLRAWVSIGISGIYDNVLLFFGALIFMMLMSPQVTGMVLILTPVLAVAAWWFRKIIGPMYRDVREQNAVLNTLTQENMAGIHVVKAFCREEYEEERFRKENRKLLDINLAATWVSSNFTPVMTLLSALCTPITLAGGALMIKNGSIDIGTLVGLTGYIWMLTNPMSQISGLINQTAQMITGAEKLFYYADVGSNIKEQPDAVEKQTLEGRVEFDHVDFSYGDTPVLQDITFTAEPGQTIAVMGATGTGKSTLVTLLGRFYDVTGGSIRIDGTDVRSYKLSSLRSHIAYCMQDTFLFSDTIEDNIRFGSPDAPHDLVAQAAHTACADEFIDECPGGYQTIIGERGMGLSGGQRQRTCIARAVLTDPAILVLDDSTSAVDMETEFVIQQRMKQVLKNRTTFIIAHRISSVKNADQILVLKDGRIAERGTHSELLQKGGIYAGMVADQMSSAVKG